MQQTIKTKLISRPTVSVPASFTALHLAHVAWNLYSSTAPTHFANEFSICDGGDFAMYGIDDSKHMSDHFYDSAFAIANYVQQDSNYSIQDAFDTIDDISADTIVRENVSDLLYNAINDLVNDSNYNMYTDYIVEDYAYLKEEQTASVNAQIQKLETQLASLKATQ